MNDLNKRLKMDFQQNKIHNIVKNPIKYFFYYLAKRSTQLFHTHIKITTKTFWNENMFIVVPEPVSLEIFLNGYFEIGLTKMILKYVKKSMTFCDIGAHFGYFTLLASTIVGENGKVYSFEPTPSTYKILLDNIKGKNNIVINNCAIYSKNTNMIFNDYGIKYSAFNSFRKARLDDKTLKHVTPNKYKINAISFDEYVYKKKIKPDFIKIDAESVEYEILKGMNKTIEEFHPIISLEVGDMAIPGAKTSRETILYLIRQGYEAFEYRDNKVVKHNLKDQYGYDNILFLYK